MVAKAKIAAAAVARKRRVEQDIEDADVEHARPQSLKLIILRITKMPMRHPDDAARQHQIAQLLGEQQRRCRRASSDRRCPSPPGGSEPMIMAEALASDDSALILPCIRLRSRSTPKIAQRLGEVAARFLLDGHHDGEEAHFRRRHALVHALQALFERHADLQAFDQRGELARRPARAISLATILSASFVGRPDLMLRTMTSMALANSAVNFFCAAVAAGKPSTQRGKPRPTPKRASSGDEQRLAGEQAARARPATPQPPLTIQKCAA